MDAVIEHALRAPTPGRLVRWGGRLVPGIGRTRDQIVEVADHWRRRADTALASPAPVLVALGDSLAQGIGASDPRRSYVGRLAAVLAEDDHHPIPVLNLSRSGARVGDVLDEQLPALSASRVRVGALVCTVGSNDLLRSSRVTATSRRLEELLDHLPDRSVIATLPAAGSVAAKVVNRRLRRAAASAGVPVADVGRSLDSWRGRMAGDGFHPDDRGHEVWFDTFLPPVRAIWPPADPDH